MSGTKTTGDLVFLWQLSPDWTLPPNAHSLAHSLNSIQDASNIARRKNEERRRNRRESGKRVGKGIEHRLQTECLFPPNSYDDNECLR